MNSLDPRLTQNSMYQTRNFSKVASNILKDYKLQSNLIFANSTKSTSANVSLDIDPLDYRQSSLDKNSLNPQRKVAQNLINRTVTKPENTLLCKNYVFQLEAN